jgi:hypothetical protein
LDINPHFSPKWEEHTQKSVNPDAKHQTVCHWAKQEWNEQNVVTCLKGNEIQPGGHREEFDGHAEHGERGAEVVQANEHIATVVQHPMIEIQIKC